jgi:hypothetical protein
LALAWFINSEPIPNVADSPAIADPNVGFGGLEDGFEGVLGFGGLEEAGVDEDGIESPPA